MKSVTGLSDQYTNSQFVVSARDSQGCHVQHGVFQAENNETFHTSVKSSVPIDFLILYQDSYNTLQYTLICSSYYTLWELQSANGFLYKRDVTMYDTDWQAGRTGTYYFVFLNRGLIDASVTFNAWTTKS